MKASVILALTPLFPLLFLVVCLRECCLGRRAKQVLLLEDLLRKSSQTQSSSPGQHSKERARQLHRG
jgi:hypothetical protein